MDRLSHGYYVIHYQHCHFVDVYHKSSSSVSISENFGSKILVRCFLRKTFQDTSHVGKIIAHQKRETYSLTGFLMLQGIPQSQTLHYLC